MAKVVYLHFSDGAAHDAQRAAYKDVDAAVAEAARCASCAAPSEKWR